MKVLCVALANSSRSDHWLTLNQEYYVLSILMHSRGPAKFRIMADDHRTPIFADATQFASTPQSMPRTWVVAVRGEGVIEIGPRSWLEPGFWERYFDGDVDAVAQFQKEKIGLTSRPD